MVETLNRPEHPEHFDVHHENGKALMCMPSDGKCRVSVEVMDGYSQKEEQQLIASTTSALKAIDRFTGGKAADIFSGLHIKIGEDIAESGAKEVAEENQVLLNGKKMLLSVADMKRVSGAYSEGELSGFPDEHRPGGALEYTLAHEIGRVLYGQTKTGKANEWHSDDKDHEAFAEGFAHAVYGMPVSETTDATVRETIDARVLKIADRQTHAARLVEDSAEQVTPSVSVGEPLLGSPEAGEKEQHAQPFEIILMRHGTPYRPSVVPDNPEDAARLGKLTEQGVKEARITTKQVAETALSNGMPTTFFILGSPTPYYLNGQAFAERSMETAQIARQTIEEVIRTKGLTPEQADTHVFGSEVDALKSGSVGSRPTKHLEEPDFYAVQGSDDTFDYRYAHAVRALAKEEGSIEKYGGPGHLEPWLRSDLSLEGLRDEVGAQSAPEVAARVTKFMGVLERYARIWQKNHPDRKMVFILASHGEIMRTVIQHGFGAGENAQGKVYEMAEAMPIVIENGKATTEFNGKPYEVDL